MLVPVLAAWIALGTPAPQGAEEVAREPSPSREAAREHWAFRRPHASRPPAVRLESWARTPIDRFILEKLEAAGLSPSPEADRRTLIRRLAHDITGLAPAFEEVEAFTRDERPDAYERLADRLLASPAYGEHWGRHWLDVARYADTKGYVYDRDERRFVHSHVYRDWVVRSLNEDLPYDRFLMEQIAADRLLAEEGAQGDRRSLAAMGFLTLGQRFLGVVHDIIDDRIDVVMRGTQALTVTCARCHDHKYDPIPTEDYYSLYGVFRASAETLADIEHPAAGSDPERAAYIEERRRREEALASAFAEKRAELEARLRARAGEYLRAVLRASELPGEEFYTIMGKDDVNPVIVRQWQAHVRAAGKSDRVFGPWNALAEIPAGAFAAEAPRTTEGFLAAPSQPPGAGAGSAAGGAGGGPRLNARIAAALAAVPPGSMEDVARRYGALLAEVEAEWERRRAEARTAGVPEPSGLADPDLEEIRRLLYAEDSPARIPHGPVSDVEWFFDEGTRVELAKLQARIEAWHIEAAGAPPIAGILEDAQAAASNPRVFVRGNPKERGAEVPRRYLAALSGPERRPFARGSGRLELARAIASAENPLTARVIVNRLWLHHFGAGLVATPSDFGTRAEPPSHPELLDDLAARFVTDGWSLKRLHRLIVLSSVYRQSSAERAEGIRADPENRLLWRMERRRLAFEPLRDAILLASGDLDRRLGGPSVDIFSPPYPLRRTLYGRIDRQFFASALRTFDVASPDAHSPQRFATTVPQQALFLMNHPFVIERARALLRQDDVLAAAEGAERLRQLYARLYQRLPGETDVAAALRFLAESRARAAAGPAPPAPAGASAWQYGYGEIGETGETGEGAGRVRSFTPLPHFTGSAWQGGPAWPDPALGWVQLTALGGHAGNDLEHAAVRRWVAPRAGEVSISGALRHAHPEGEGIRARITSSRAGLLGAWILHNQSAATELGPVAVEAGETIDFVVDLKGALGWDDFTWAPVVRAADADWSAERDFHGPMAQPLSPWECLAQALLLANELAFVD
jgi:hypothetical protein